MDIFKSRTINVDKGYFNYHSFVKQMLKQAALKARIPIRSIIEFFADQRQPFKNINTGRSLPSNKSIAISPNFYQPKMNSKYNIMAQKKINTRVNIIDFGLEKTCDLLEDNTYMSQAQIVFAVIYNQQVEWMNDSEKVS